MLKFDVLENGMGLVSSLNFAYDFSRKMFLKLYSINLSGFIAWLLLLLEILGSICVLQPFVNQAVIP